MNVLHTEANASLLRVLHEAKPNARFGSRILTRCELNNRNRCPTCIVGDCARLLYESSVACVVQLLRLRAGRTQTRAALELSQVFLDGRDAHARPCLVLRL